MIKLNKKGFTLVELLAVIVILALLIVVVANTALPALDNSKKSSLNVYAGRVLNSAKNVFQTEVLNSNHDTFKEISSGTNKYCATMTSLMGSNKQYFGYVLVDNTGTDAVYYIRVTDGPNKLSYIKSASTNTATAIVSSKLEVKNIGKISANETSDPTCPTGATAAAAATAFTNAITN